jgi:prepilin-type N-terminal cleavage/methylation domain-containing protein
MLKHVTSRPGWDEKGIGAKGFTLVELLVVIVILGILGAVVVFAVGGISGRGQDAACRTENRSIKTAAEAYRAREERLPANMAAMVPDFLESTPGDYTYAFDDNSTPTNFNDDDYTVAAIPTASGGDCA